jgi:hypothetical protein
MLRFNTLRSRLNTVRCSLAEICASSSSRQSLPFKLSKPSIRRWGCELAKMRVEDETDLAFRSRLKMREPGKIQRTEHQTLILSPCCSRREKAAG